MCVTSQTILTRLAWAAPAAMLRAGCVALFVCVSGCGGGSDGASPLSSTAATPAPMPAPDSTPPPPAAAQLVVGTAQSIDSGASGTPLNLRVARSTLPGRRRGIKSREHQISVASHEKDRCDDCVGVAPTLLYQRVDWRVGRGTQEYA
jgi:hypothetical protein